MQERRKVFSLVWVELPHFKSLTTRRLKHWQKYCLILLLPLITEAQLFTRCSLLVEIHSLLVARCKITCYSLQKSLVTRCRSCSLQKFTRYSLQNSLVTCCRSCSLQNSLVTRCRSCSLQNLLVTRCNKSFVTQCKKSFIKR